MHENLSLNCVFFLLFLITFKRSLSPYFWFVTSIKCMLTIWSTIQRALIYRNLWPQHTSSIITLNTFRLWQWTLPHAGLLWHTGRCCTPVHWRVGKMLARAGVECWHVGALSLSVCVVIADLTRVSLLLSCTTGVQPQPQSPGQTDSGPGVLKPAINHTHKGLLVQVWFVTYKVMLVPPAHRPSGLVLIQEPYGTDSDLSRQKRRDLFRRLVS